MRPARFVFPGLALLAAAGAAHATPPTIADLGFMAGSWTTQSGPARVDEQWSCPGPDSMLGIGRTIAKGKTAYFEFLRIETRPDGLVYVAQPKGGPPTDFKLVKLEGGAAVFENLAHDFPKRIIYTKTADGGLTARVEGDATSKEKAEEFRYRPVAGGCR